MQSKDKGEVFEYLCKFSEKQSIAGLCSEGKEERATFLLSIVKWKTAHINSRMMFFLLAVVGRGRWENFLPLALMKLVCL